jgi:hypothetical protein
MTGHKNVIARDFSPFHFRTSAHLYESIGATSERVLAFRLGSAWRDVEIQENQIERVPSGRRVVAMFSVLRRVDRHDFSKSDSTPKIFGQGTFFFNATLARNR